MLASLVFIVISFILVAKSVTLFDFLLAGSLYGIGFASILPIERSLFDTCQ